MNSMLDTPITIHNTYIKWILHVGDHHLIYILQAYACHVFLYYVRRMDTTIIQTNV